jgi:F-type H+-transporting ATPase subunit alpha
MTKLKQLTKYINNILNNNAPQFQNIGHVIEIADGIAKVDKLNSVTFGELVLFEENELGIAYNLEENNVGIIIINSTHQIRQGALVKTLGKIAQIPIGKNLLGRVVNPLMEPLDGKKLTNLKKTRLIESSAPGIISREGINEPLHTGIIAIDALIPIGKGQRELIIGDKQTGKTTIALDTIINQKNKNVICIYIAIGQRASTVVQTMLLLKKYDALKYTIIIAANADDSATLQFLAPYSGTSVAEYFMYKKKNVLIIYDDLTKHAQSYREISLLLKRSPGREAFPGDIFYTHSRLLERSAKLNKLLGGGSITALPIVETEAGDISSYIPTNIISITDGQIFLSQDLFNAGIRPAIDVGISVSRIGSAAQTKIMKKIVGKLKLDIARIVELESFSKFSLNPEPGSLQLLARGKYFKEILKQSQFSPKSLTEQIILIFAGMNGYLDFMELEDIKTFILKVNKYIYSEENILKKKINKKHLNFLEIEEELKNLVLKFLN